MIERLLDLFWPRLCEVCRRPVDRPGRHVCTDCLNRLAFVPADGCCRRCGRDVPALDHEFICEDCRIHRPAFDRVRSSLRFEGEARELVNAYKFKRHLQLHTDFVDWLEATVTSGFKIESIDAILPMPSTLLHRWGRGYNQCELLARTLAKRLGKPLLSGALSRIGHPRRQGGLTEAERRENVVGTFAVRPSARLSGATLLLVDDIMTTGSTLSEAAKTLKAAGARRIWAVTLSRTVRMSSR